MQLSWRATHDVIYDVSVLFTKRNMIRPKTVSYVRIIGAKRQVSRVVKLTAALLSDLKVETHFLQRFPNISPSLRGQSSA